MNLAKRTYTKSISSTLALLFFIAVGYLWWSSQQTDASDQGGQTNDAPVFKVQKGPFTVDVVESGTVRPRDQIILRNDMWESSTIIHIVEEGKRVNKGNLVVELDATAIEREVQTSKLELQNDEANYVSARETLEVVVNQEQSNIEKAQLAYKFSQQDLKKYIEGEYPQQLKQAEASITIAKEELSQAEERLRWSQILFEEKYLSQTDLQKDQLATQKAKLNLEMAEEDLVLLKNFTHFRQLTQLESDVKQSQMALERAIRSASATITDASSRLYWRQERYEEEKDDYARLLEQIEKAKIHAPIDGVVLYASSVLEDWEDDEDRIRVGAVVDERREIVFLTAAEEYNVDIQIQETDLSKIKIGLMVDIIVDAFPEQHLKGLISSIAPLPNQRQQYLNPNLKVYNTDIELVDDVDWLRNGMSCQAKIIVQEFDDALYIPIQSVVRENEQHVVYVQHQGMTEVRPVEIGLDNSRMIHIRSGLQEGEFVLLTPPLHSENNPA